MRVIGFNFDKISIERLKDSAEDLKINANIEISEIKKIESDLLKTKDELVQAKFSYGIKYEPGFADIDLKGTVLLGMDEKQTKELMKDWKKKQMPDDFKTFLFNVIMRKAALMSLPLEDQLNLPLHLPLPTVKIEKENNLK